MDHDPTNTPSPTLDLEARLARVGAHLDAVAARDASAGFSSDLTYARRTTPARRLALAAAVALVVAAVGGGVLLARHDRGGTGISTDPSTTAPPPDSTTLPFGIAVLEARPVVATSPASVANDDDCPEPQVASADGATCFELGEPVAFTEADIAHAETVLQNEWTVSVTLRTASRAKASQLFDACYAAEPACPAPPDSHGAMAFVWRNRVISAPEVAARGLVDGPITITGRPSATSPPFTQTEAQELTADLQP